MFCTSASVRADLSPELSDSQSASYSLDGQGVSGLQAKFPQDSHWDSELSFPTEVGDTGTGPGDAHYHVIILY
jgi:hypothetical protein